MNRWRTVVAFFVRVAREPRQPLVGVALCAAAGIGLADGFWRHGPGWPLVGFLALAVLWWRCRRTWLCWLTVLAAFAGLHVFRTQAVPARSLAARFGETPRAVRVVGRVADEPRARAGAPSARFTLALERVEFDGRAWRSSAPVIVGWPLAARAGVAAPALPAWGDRVELVGTARNLAAPRNPGQTDFAALARRRGVFSELRVWQGPGGGSRVLESDNGWRSVLGRATTRARRWMAAKLALDLEDEPEVAAVVRSMVLGLGGEGEGVERGTLGQALQETGTLHFFAVDGLKIGLLVGIGLFALQLGGLRREIAGVVAVPVLAFYALATGLGPASLRATIIAGIFWVGLLRDQPTRAANNLGAAASLILLWDTQQLFSRGFQLSFVVVAVILLLQRPLHERLQRWGEPDPFLPRQLWPRWQRAAGEPARRWLLGLLGVSLAAWLGSLPLMIYWFHLASLSSVAANVVAFPLAFLVLVLGVLTLVVAAVSSAWAALINNANWCFAKLLIGWVKLAALAPGGHAYLGGASDYPFLAPWREQPVAELTVLNLGRGSSALHLRAGRADWLLDAGRVFDWETVVRPALHARGVNRLDALLLRQDDAAHAGAAPLALTEFRPRRVLEPPVPTNRSPARREWNQALAAAHRSPASCQRGDTLPVAAGVELRVLYPTSGMKPRLADDRALALQLCAAGSATRVLLMANAGEEVERWLLANEPADGLRSDVLMLGAHQESSSGGADFLRAVRPRLIIFQADFRDAFGEAPLVPTDQEIAAAFAQIGVPAPEILRTEQVGAVNLRLWRERAEAKGFVSERRVILRR